jgi:C-terminal processing protease CtpA/Prc
MRITRLCSLAVLSTLSLAQCAMGQDAQKIDRDDLKLAHAMLHQAYVEVKKNYYDPAYHGVDLDGSYRELDARLDSARSLDDSLFIIATFLARLNDSHTYFLPPQRVRLWAPGFAVEMVGDKCFVTQIRPGSDAEGKLHVGDEVLAFDGIAVKRETLAHTRYLMNVLWQPVTQGLVVRKLSGEIDREVVLPMTRNGKSRLIIGGSGVDLGDLRRESEDNEEINRARAFERGDALIWKMPSFSARVETIDAMFAKARKHRALVVDLRGNSGGNTDALKEMIANIFDGEVVLGTEVSRRGLRLETTKPKSKAFSGNLIVLIDSDSSSAAEVFARVVQLEHRGIVVGDRSAGAVMEARRFDEWLGTDDKIFYSFSITSAGFLTSDGKSIENAGVVPDVTVLPTAEEMAEGEDPVLSRGAELAGAELDPVEAGKLFPFEWPAF